MTLVLVLYHGGMFFINGPCIGVRCLFGLVASWWLGPVVRPCACHRKKVCDDCELNVRHSTQQCHLQHTPFRIGEIKACCRVGMCCLVACCTCPRLGWFMPEGRMCPEHRRGEGAPEVHWHSPQKDHACGGHAWGRMCLEHCHREHHMGGNKCAYS